MTKRFDNLSILFSDRKDWEPRVAPCLPHHRLTFADFRAVDVAGFDLVIPLDIPDQMHVNAVRRSSPRIPALVPSDECMRLCDDKLAFHAFMRRSGFRGLVPAVGDELPQPYILKPISGEWGRDVVVVRSDDDERAQRDARAAGRFFQQEYIVGHREYTMHLLVHDGAIRFSRTLEFVFADAFHVKGDACPYSSLQEVDHTRLEGVFGDILAAMAYEGMGCFNYKLTGDTQVHIFEFNPRWGGSIPFFMNDAVDSYARAVLESCREPA